MSEPQLPQDPRGAKQQVTEPLMASWRADCRVLAPEVQPELVNADGQWLLQAWSEPQRRYHNVQHLSEVLLALQELSDAGEVDQVGARLARIAAWFHDAAYDPASAPGSNEHRSATLARDHLHHLGVAPGNVDVVEALVLMTLDHHVDGPGSTLASWRHTASVLHDADLWILSAPPARYREYADQVRREYAHVPDPLFAQARAQILAGFAQRDALYRTATARERWEPRARANLQDELTTLRA